MKTQINLNAAEIQSRANRQQWAERLIAQLPTHHDGRNSWLINYGEGAEGASLRYNRNIAWDEETKSAHCTNETKQGHSRVVQDPKKVLEQLDAMCTQSLPPELHDAWEVIKHNLTANRADLKAFPPKE